MENYDFPEAKFDLVTSSLAVQYVEDFDRLIKGISRCLRPGGQLVFSQEHPVFTCIEEDDFWVRDAQGKKMSLKHFHYSQEGPVQTGWLGVDMTIYHRRLETVVSTLLKHHLQIEALRESEVSPEVIEKYPELADTREAPNFIFFRCRKI